MKAMNKRFVAAVIATSLTACQQESFEVRTDSDNYYASVETFATGTKTALGENRSVVWSSEDRIAIFEGKDVGHAYQVLDSYVGKSSGEFAEVEGLVTEGIGAAIDGTVAVYPFNEGLTVTSGDNGDYVIEGVTFPSEQKYVAGSFSDEAFPMVAVTSDKNLSFKNVGGVLKLSLTGSYSVSKITLTGNSGELLSGPATVTLGSDGIPSVTMSDDASTSVTLVCDPAVELDPEKTTDFNISIPPTVFEEGFNISIIDSYGESRGKSTDKLNKVERSKMLVMPELANSDYAYIDLSNNPEWETGIIAEDGRYLLVKKDTTNNGYISYINSSAFDSDGIVLYYDKNIELLSFVTNKGACYINREADNADIILVLDDESHIYENITLNTIEIAMTKAAPVIPIIVGVATGIATVKNIWDTVQATKELNDGNWDGARLDYLKLLGGTAAKNPFGGFVIDGAFGVLYKAKEDLDNKVQTCFLGNCQIQIKQTKIGIKKFRIDVTVTGYETLPIISKITGEKSVVIGGIAVRDLPYVSYSNNEYLLEEWIINGNGTKSIEFELPEDRTYYAVPYLLPTRGGKYPFKGNVRYGNTTKLPYFYGVIDQFKQTSFLENNDKYVFKCYAHAICNTKNDRIWKLYYENDNGWKEFYCAKVYDEPSIGSVNTAEFEFDIEIKAGLFNNGEKDINLGIAVFDQSNHLLIASEPQMFMLKAPSCITGGVSEITSNSAVINCTYNYIPDDGQCQVILSWDDGHKIVKAENREGEQEISLTDLEPNTTYSYCACIDYEGGPVNGETKEFTTKSQLPKIKIENIDVLYAEDQGWYQDPEHDYFYDHVLCGFELDVDLSSSAEYFKDKTLYSRLVINGRSTAGSFFLDSNSNKIRIDNVRVSRSEDLWNYVNGEYVAEVGIDICTAKDEQIITQYPYKLKVKMEQPLPVVLKILMEELEIKCYENGYSYEYFYDYFCSVGNPIYIDLDYGFSVLHHIDKVQVESIYKYTTTKCYQYEGDPIPEIRTFNHELCCYSPNQNVIYGGGSTWISDDRYMAGGNPYGSYTTEEIKFVATLKDGTILTETIFLAPPGVTGE